MKNILFLLGFIFVQTILSAQIKTVKEYTKKTGLCSQSLKLYSNNTYLYELGCEGRSNVNFGTWKKDKQNINLYPIDIATHSFFTEITESKKETGDSSLTIQVVDAYNRPVKYFPLMVISDVYDLDNRIQSDKDQYIYVNKMTNSMEFLYPNMTDEQGIIFASNKRTFQITPLFPNDMRVIHYINNENNTITIKLNLNKDVFTYPEVRWISVDVCEFDGKVFQFVK